ncbi:putative nuclear speckle splicing regulatory protein 1 like protein [Amylocarpus encephaloides]|uniref:Nuclear speckle splicing regulatory protein 1 like protein n=1 Tax=Amylocarpus encephaloides TaxID=45428 RepID=A0A9P8C4T1_9HELO|nr:putative nuclear speckle splicing regulatory protein 1 like protein [Amylocarpus encephaloides]
MSGAGLSYGLNISKKKPGGKPPPPKRKTIFDDEDDSDDGKSKEIGVEEIGEIGGLSSGTKSSLPSRATGPLGSKVKRNGGAQKASLSMYADLSTSFTSKKHTETAEELDANIYDYDAVYDSLKPQKKITQDDKERKPKYMTNLLAAAAVRKRDATIAEEKKLARDREAEGDEYADKEKFVTSAYKKQQEEARRLEEEERIKEAQEQKKNKGSGMTKFYMNMLDKEEKKHAEIVKAAEENAKKEPAVEEEEKKEKSEADIAHEINQKTGGDVITVNDEGEVVDKRQLLKGGLNIVPKSKGAAASNPSRGAQSASDRKGPGFVGAGGGKQAMRERQSRMMEAQLEKATKRALEQDEEDRLKIERAAKSRKTEGDIMSAKERYLARKKEAEEAKKRGAVP